MQTPSFRAARAIAVAALLSTAPATLAGLGDFFLLNNSSAGLYRGQVGVDNGEGLLGPLPIGSWYDLAPGFDPSAVFAMRGHTLVSLSTTDAAQITSVSPDREFINIATDTATSTLYAVTSGVPGTSQFGELLTVDPVTGQTTTIGQLGGGTDGLPLVGLGFDPFSGNLFLTTGTGALFSINANSGAATFVGATGLSHPYDIDYNPADGNMYITDAGTGQLFTVDRTDASVIPSTLHSGVSLSTGLAFAIPTPGTTAILALAGLGAARRRR